MDKKKILVTGIVPKEGLRKLMDRFDVTYSEDRPFSRDYVLEHLSEYDGWLLMGQKGDKEMIDAGENLQIISLNAVGFDHVDTAYAKEKGIIVSNSPQAVRVPTAEMTFALILAASKRLAFYDSIVRSGEWIDPSEQRYQGLTLQGSTLGIYGMGRIGLTVANFAKAFGMTVVYNDVYRLPEDKEKELGVTYLEFDQLIKTADVITIHAPALPSTIHKFNKDVFAKMKNRSYLINAARGPIVSEEALIEALKEGEIAGAGLDVFENEPQVSEGLRSLDNVIMSPHAGTGTIEGRRTLAEEAADNIIAFFDGKPQNIVNK
ncbi:TPA: NAD(P)-dependent oxidoreductase [Streptococcus agalactiae]|jgi:Lactate dehydrogenase and related dehydrogenases|uniref:Glyoxylate reductase, NADH-dependent n=6 Tax=Bacteria TaxID=2 RepID=Q8DXP4_STRA5|nr:MULTISPECIES: NAD(P)-dependent oxidoreductase [Streptococcus]EAO62791.1 D-isomer specific 2-hydroxyacid dehydrogenase family protein [Streptococcus agalactiae 18RS21]EPX10339.1 dihydrofolate reductase [Streptococcus agalactiae MRI Z1-049]HEO8209143.1 dihydrofolate reductase [Streptococcus agalactiae ADL-350]AAN00669.1 glyoxylate reductase, NADH-dependent [Streptococcus agalactiae 2603V/R]AIK72375.1 dihydrofolate reductase [Streptococcus agalactiae]